MASEFVGQPVDDKVANEHVKNLSEEEKLQIGQVKDIEAEFINACRAMGVSRDLSLAITHMEDAAMRAVRHITSPGPKAPPRSREG